MVFSTNCFTYSYPQKMGAKQLQRKSQISMNNREKMFGFFFLFICFRVLFPLAFFFKFLMVTFELCKAVNFRVSYILGTSEHILACKSHNHWLMLKFKEYYQEKNAGSFWRWTAFFVRLAYMQKESPKLFSRQLGK